MNRALLTKLHLIAAAFMFPAVLMFLLTGGLYTWGNKGEWIESSARVELTSAYESQDEAGLKDIATQALAEQGLPMPSGTALLSGTGMEQTLTWTGARSEASVSVATEPMAAEVAMKEASVHRWLVQLHKAKGSVWFKIYATALAVVLFILVASGLVMGLQVKSLRRITVMSSVIGAVGFVGFVLAG